MDTKEPAIESKVPGEHKMRRDVTKDTEADKITTREDDIIATNSDATLSPVITVTKKEETFTKGDLKLQKVTVSEDISITTLIDKDIDEGSRNQNEVCEKHRNIRDDTTASLTHIRPIKETTGTSGETAENLQNVSTTKAKTKTGSKIPKFKAAVEKIKKNLKTSKLSLREIEYFPSQESIQLLQDPTPELKTQNGRKNTQKENVDIKNESPITDEEFEKIYDEIVNNDNDVFNVNVINTNDVDKIEIKFEELIHGYEENEIQPIVTKKSKSKIPLLKSKSMQDFEVLKTENVMLPRKNSVGKIPIPSSIKDNSTNAIAEKHEIIDFSKIGSEDSINKILSPICQNSHYKIFKNKTPLPASFTKIPISQKSNARISSVSLNKQPKRFNLHRNRFMQEYDMILNKECTNSNCNQTNSSNHLNKNNYNDNLNSNIIIQCQPENASASNNNQTCEMNNNISSKLNLKCNELDQQTLHTSNEIIKKNHTNSAILETTENNDHLLDRQESIGVVTKYCSDDPKIISDKVLYEKETKYVVSAKRQKEFTNNDEDNDKKETKQGGLHETDNHKMQISNNELVNIRDAISSQSKVIKHKCIEPVTFDERKEEDIIILKGKVNRVISRLDSLETKVIRKTWGDLPKQSVKSKISLFENKFQNLQTRNLSCHKSNKCTETIYRPRVIDAILKEGKDPSLHDTDEVKDTELRNKDTKEFDSKYKLENTEHNNIKFKSKINGNASLDKKVLNSSHHNSSINVCIADVDLENNKTNNNDIDQIFVENEVFAKKCDEIVNAYKIRQEEKIADVEADLKRSISIAKLELYDNGTKIKCRTKSLDKMEFRREVIDLREKPREGAVSKNIALFESRLATPRLGVAKSISSIMSTTPQKLEISGGITKKLAKGHELEGEKFEDMTYLHLRDGYKMPSVSVGTALLEPDRTYEIVKMAIEMGYRAFDTAYIYGNERQVGEAIREKITDGTVSRDELFVASKLWSTFHRRDLAVEACRQSLDTMGLDYFDLFMIHMPMSFKEDLGPLPTVANVMQYSEYDYMDAWYGIEELVKSGLVKLAGVSNFNSEQLLRILEKGKVKPVINQVESHPYLSQMPLHNFCENYDVKLNVFGILGSKGTPEEFKSNTNSVIDDPLVKLMSAGLKITPAQLLISYQLHLGRSVVVKCSNADRLWANLQAPNVQLRPEYITALSSLNSNRRTFTFKGMGDTHKNYPFKIDY